MGTIATASTKLKTEERMQTPEAREKECHSKCILEECPDSWQAFPKL